MEKQQKFFTLVPTGTNIQFVKNRWRYIMISLVAIAISIGAMVFNSVTEGSALNFGIDFAGGSQVRLALAEDKDPGIDEIRKALDELGYEGASAVTVPESDHEVLIRVKDTLSTDEAEIEKCFESVQQVPKAVRAEEADAAGAADEMAELIASTHPEGGSKLFLKYDAEPDYRVVETRINEAGCEGTADKGFGAPEGEYPVEFALIGMGTELSEQLDDKFGAGTVKEIVRSETVGAKVGGQLKQDGAKSMLYAIGFIFLFVMIRFDLRFAPGGIVALTHDALLVVGAFAITGKEFNLQTIAAILTVIGYSINDTIVVFDRVRERVALNRDTPLEETSNQALNDTLSRTILTSGTTLIVVASTWALGSGSIKDFAFALIVGILVGTYSSLYIATPVFLWVNKRFYAGKGHLEWLDHEEREGTGTLLGGKPEGEAEPGGPDADPAAEGREPDVAGPRPKASRRRRRRPDS